jgi:hypothetical protein
MARTAVIAGTATAVSGKVAASQQQKMMAQQQAAAPPPAPEPAAPAAPAEDPTIAQLQQLAALHAQGILTDEEFSAKKAQLLGI